MRIYLASAAMVCAVLLEYLLTDETLPSRADMMRAGGQGIAAFVVAWIGLKGVEL